MKRVIISIALVILAATASVYGAGINNAADNNSVIAANKQQLAGTAANSATVNYEIIKQTYTDREITINYPQIVKLSDTKKQKIINEIIRTEALYILSTLNPDYETSMTIDYEIEWQSPALLSIKYSGLRSAEDAAHPTDEFYTTNINMHQGTRLRLKDLININDNFVEKFKKGKLIAVSPEITFDLLGYSDDELIEALSAADLINNSQIDTFSYFTKDSLGISLAVSHAIGDHVEMEVKYQDIADNIKTENEVWQEFLR